MSNLFYTSFVCLNWNRFHEYLFVWKEKGQEHHSNESFILIFGEKKSNCYSMLENMAHQWIWSFLWRDRHSAEINSRRYFKDGLWLALLPHELYLIRSLITNLAVLLFQPGKKEYLKCLTTCILGGGNPNHLKQKGTKPPHCSIFFKFCLSNFVQRED